ncbi:hypothetical protein HIM_08967 [Hirsutella minnesotensis 3608]|uniref:Uncharacterized protein n=1 Tax=Hirsutella minnesotensis 3608 TaxID=1043627 RepID=A0A0F7ZM36_9HYPO|nr:hypothetical protein HIM_08967 [Hirsutella minnesotensis 3608]
MKLRSASSRPLGHSMTLRMLPSRVNTNNSQASSSADAPTVKKEETQPPTLRSLRMFPLENKNSRSAQTLEQKLKTFKEIKKEKRKRAHLRKKAELEKLQKDVPKPKTLSEQVAKLEGDAESLSKANKELVAKSAQLASEIEELTTKLKRTTDRNTELSKKIDTLKAQNSRLESERDEARDENKLLAKTIENTRAKLVGTQEALEAQKTRNERLAGELAAEKRAREELASREELLEFESRWVRTALAAAFKLLPSVSDQVTYRGLLEKTRHYLLEKHGAEARARGGVDDVAARLAALSRLRAGGGRGGDSQASFASPWNRDTKTLSSKGHLLNDDDDDDDDDVLDKMRVKAEEEWAMASGIKTPTQGSPVSKMKRELPSSPPRSAKRLRHLTPLEFSDDEEQAAKAAAGDDEQEILEVDMNGDTENQKMEAQVGVDEQQATKSVASDVEDQRLEAEFGVGTIEQYHEEATHNVEGLQMMKDHFFPEHYSRHSLASRPFHGYQP